MGVITVTDVDYGQIFGPFPSYLISTDPAYVIGLLTNDKQPDGIVLRVDTSEKRGKTLAVDWLPYVSSARDEDEQNMEAYLKEGCIYYRTLRIVKAGEELLVWYSKDFSQILGIPELQIHSKREDEQFICSHCGEMFDFPYPLRAHLKFKCSFACDDGMLPAQSNITYSPTITSSGHLHKHLPDQEKNEKSQSHHTTNESPSDVNRKNNNNTVFPLSFRKRQLNGWDSEATSHNKVPALNNKSPAEAPVLSHSIEKLSKSHVPKQESSPACENGLDVHSENISAFRKVEKSLSNSNLKAPSPPGIASLRSAHDTISSKSVHLSSTYSAVSTSSAFDTSRVVGLHKPSPLNTGSKSLTVDSDPPTSSMRDQSKSPMKGPSSSSVPPPSRTDPALTTPQLMGMYMPRLPMLPQAAPLGMVRPGFLTPSMGTSPSRSIPVPHSAFPDQIPPGLLEMCRATIPTVGPLTESFAANIRKMDIHDTLSKQALFADRHISTLGFLKSTNPMVEKLLQTTNPTMLSSPINALNLSQNWCAKCNATFRMTSDLVYHMRSHHKREFDPMKRKREEKLKCNICNETFRERHHLTRHMSSHA